MPAVLGAVSNNKGRPQRPTFTAALVSGMMIKNPDLGRFCYHLPEPRSLLEPFVQ
jgi:hypothetical protein